MVSNQKITAIVLAAGQGTRMKSQLPKVLHPVAGIPMIERSIQVLKKSGVDEIRVVLGHGRELVEPRVQSLGAHTYVQTHQRGTADAVKSADIDTCEELVLIVNADHPLLQVQDIKDAVESFIEARLDLGVVTTHLDDPKSYGRIIRQGPQLYGIVEVKDASPEALKIKEINTGIYLVRANVLKTYLPLIASKNQQKEFYLTDLIQIAREHQSSIGTLQGSSHTAYGVNTQNELAEATRILFLAKAEALMNSGVTLLDPLRTFIEENVSVGPSTVIGSGVHLRGKTQVGTFCQIEAYSFITDSFIDSEVQIKAGSYIESSVIKKQSSVGPYARLRPQTKLDENVHIGNFVELKKTTMGAHSKAGHLSYLGDATIGTNTNIGCGTITCNYAPDRKKYQTEIGNNVFVGSDTQFIAPIQVGDNSVIGSGSTITKNIPNGALAVARSRQFIKENYKQTPALPKDLEKEK